MQIELKNVSYSYSPPGLDSVIALKDISFSVESGDFLGIMGHTGCGKSTLIQLIAGLIAPESGQVLINGQDINDSHYDRNLLRSTVGVVFQYPEYQLFESTVEKDAAFGLKHSKLSKSEIKERVRWALELMNFDYEAIRSQSPLALSGGEKRRAAIAGILAAKPSIMIFDEPLAGLDPTGRESFLSLVTSLNRDGTTVIMISHNTDAVAEYSKHTLILDRGRIAAFGTAKAVFSQTLQHNYIPVTSAAALALQLKKHGLMLSDGIYAKEELLDALIAALNSKEQSTVKKAELERGLL